MDIIAYDDRSQKHPAEANVPDWLPKHEFLLLIIAPAGSGKTTLLLNLLLRIYKGYWQDMYVFSPTLSNDAKWDHLTETPGVLMKTKPLAGMPVDDEKGIRGAAAAGSSKKKDDDDDDDDDIHDTARRLLNKKRQVTYQKSKNRLPEKRRLSKQMEKRYKKRWDAQADMFGRTHRTKPVTEEEMVKHLIRRQSLASHMLTPPTPDERKVLREVKERILRIPSHQIREPHVDVGEFSLSKYFSQHVMGGEDDDDDDSDGDLLEKKEDEKGGRGRVPEQRLFEEYNEDELHRVMDIKDKQVKWLKKHKKSLTKYMPRTVWVFDDMVGSGLFNQQRNNAFKRLTVRRRHFYSSMIGVTQAYREIPVTTRTNASALILFRIDSDRELSVIYEEYPMGYKFHEWLRLVQWATEAPFSFIMFNIQQSDPDKRIIQSQRGPLSRAFIQKIISTSSATTSSSSPLLSHDEDEPSSSDEGILGAAASGWKATRGKG